MKIEQELKKPLSFIHSFHRYFDLNGERFDRLHLILAHGLVSPKNAERNGIPYERRTSKINVPGYDELIFLYSINQRQGLPIPGDTTLFFENSLKIYEAQGLPSLSIGEVYVKDHIPAKFIKRIRIASREDFEDVKRMISKYIPDRKGIEVAIL